MRAPGALTAIGRSRQSRRTALVPATSPACTACARTLYRIPGSAGSPASCGRDPGTGASRTWRYGPDGHPAPQTERRTADRSAPAAPGEDAFAPGRGSDAPAGPRPCTGGCRIFPPPATVAAGTPGRNAHTGGSCSECTSGKRGCLPRTPPRSPHSGGRARSVGAFAPRLDATGDSSSPLWCDSPSTASADCPGGWPRESPQMSGRVFGDAPAGPSARRSAGTGSGPVPAPPVSAWANRIPGNRRDRPSRWDCSGRSRTRMSAAMCCGNPRRRSCADAPCSGHGKVEQHRYHNGDARAAPFVPGPPVRGRTDGCLAPRTACRSRRGRTSGTGSLAVRPPSRRLSKVRSGGSPGPGPGSGGGSTSALRCYEAAGTFDRNRRRVSGSACGGTGWHRPPSRKDAAYRYAV